MNATEMNQIKYRAWDKKRKEMLIVTRIQWDIFGSDIVMIETSNWVKDELRYYDSFDEEEDQKEPEYNLNDLELMQFTGRIDKNKDLIFEDDIVLFGENAIHGGTHGKVIWIKSKGFVYEFIDGQYKGKCTDMDDDWRTYERVGTIFENPELLEG
ncbi:MAG: YopX family protein [Methanobacterium paludis]|nr:YopX family protein [Methanobacterium paludis]